jgi:hypothetical protein
MTADHDPTVEGHDVMTDDCDVTAGVVRGGAGPAGC